MSDIVSLTSLHNCVPPAANTLDFPEDVEGVVREEYLKEVKASLQFGILRTLAPQDKKLYMVVPLPCPTDQVCVAELGSAVLRLANKKIKSLVKQYSLVVGGTETPVVASTDASADTSAAVSTPVVVAPPPHFFITPLDAEVSICSLVAASASPSSQPSTRSS